mgnify:FL=1
MTSVRRISVATDLVALREDWNRLCGGVPFCSFEWNAAWWRHYHQDGDLYVLVVCDDAERVIGIAPWYLKRNAAQGRVLAFMASGEVCSDYQRVLCEPGQESVVVNAIADWLSDVRDSLTEWVTREDEDRWDLIEWECVPVADAVLRSLTEALKGQGAAVYQRRSDACWRLNLSETWDEYEARLSKSHRKQIRRSIRNMIEAGRTEFHMARTPKDLERGFDLLVRLHQRRWTSKGEAGVFASGRFAEFHREVMRELLDQGALRLCWLEIDGTPAAADYCLADNDTVYCYQGGVDPTRLDLEPGRISKIYMLKAAREEGMVAFDWLRGDEPYKSHWRAAEVPCLELRIVARRAVAKLRNRVWLAGGRVKRMLSNQAESGEDQPRNWQKFNAPVDWPGTPMPQIPSGV